MPFGIVVHDPEDWTAKAIMRGFSGLGVDAVFLSLSAVFAEIAEEIYFRSESGESPLLDLDGLVVRDMGRGPPQDVAFRFEALTTLEALGLKVVNPPSAIIRAANKFATSVALRRAGVPTPRTVVTTSLEEASGALLDYERAVTKPLFGYKGRDLQLLSAGDRGALADIIRSRGVVYLQEFVPMDEPRDIRAFVVGDRVAGAIYRVAPPGEWISNLARGGGAKPFPLTEEVEELAVRASAAVGAVYCGVDLLETAEGPKVIEVNGTPSGKGIYSAHGIDVGGMIAKRALDLL